MTPYAKYHLTLLNINRRWLALFFRLRIKERNATKWKLAKIEGDFAFVTLQHDIEDFDEEVHGTKPEE